MTTKKLSIENLTFQATTIDVSEHILTITLNRPEKKTPKRNPPWTLKRLLYIFLNIKTF